MARLLFLTSNLQFPPTVYIWLVGVGGGGGNRVHLHIVFVLYCVCRSVGVLSCMYVIRSFTYVLRVVI